MVASLKKIEGSERFHQIVDFLNTSNIRNALTENPTIYVSLIQQFWQTTTASTPDNEEMEITATIDGKVKIVTEASVRRHLKLEDSDGISSLPTTKIFEQLSLMGSPIRHETKVPQPNSPPHTNVADEAACTSVDVRYGGATTTFIGLEAGQGSGNIDKTSTMTHDSPLPRVNILGSDEGRMQHNELMDFVTKLSDRVVALETDLTQTKKVYGVAFTKLIKKVKRLEKKDKLNKSKRKLKLVLSDEEGSNLDILALEDPSKQGRKIAQIDEDEGITLVQMGVFTASTDFTNANIPVTIAGAEISTASLEVKTTSDSVDDIVAETLRLQEQLDEEERQRITKAHEVASSFNIKEWEDIQARIEADDELAQRTVPKIADGSTKRAAEEELGQQSSKKQKSHELS
ncbi:hypothetical protein Tco_1561252 [Tanacetum coccineum]